jgi:hypothetical protein
MTRLMTVSHSTARFLIHENSISLNRNSTTEDGEYFLAAKGGPQTRWAEKNGAYRSGSEEIVSMTDEEAVDWCEKRQIDGEIILNEFEHLIET